MKRTALIPIILFFITLSSCNNKDEVIPIPDFTFESDGLDGLIISELTEAENYLVAATDKGIYVKPEGQDTWSLRGLEDKNIRAFVEINTTHWLAVENLPEAFNMYKSENQGSDWVIFETDFGGEYGQNMSDLEYVADEQKLFASGRAVVAESSDMGNTWTPIIGSWDLLASGLDFVAKAPDNALLWSGGQNAIEGFVLHSYNLDTDDHRFFMGLVDAPSTAKSILFNPGNPEQVIIGAEGGIISTEDNGDNWTLIKDDHSTSKFTFGLARDLKHSQTIYAAGWLKSFDEPQELILNFSTNNGLTWQEAGVDDSELFGGVYDMILVMENDQQVLYLGLFKGGVYKVTIDY